MPLDNLLEQDKTTCLEMLQKIETTDLWDIFLKEQVTLFFEKEMEFLAASGDWWSSANDILELGCGNGVFLNTLQNRFKDKHYLGMDKELGILDQAKLLVSEASHLNFVIGDAEIEDKTYRGQFDAVIFRLALLHLKNPRQALKNAYAYLKPGGHVIIMDACDTVRKSSHAIYELDQLFEILNGNQYTSSNRKISLEVLRELEGKQGFLPELFDVVFSNLNSEGQLVYDMRFDGPENQRKGFNHHLLLLAVFHKRRGFPINFDKAYDELKTQALDPTSWFIPGFHYLVLKKREL